MALLRFPVTERPRASIVILAWKQLDLLLACLGSIADTATPGLPFEVIVVSNDAPQQIIDAVRSRTEGVRLVEAHANLGFSGGCNLGASLARGQYLVMLNDDAIVAPGWLDWLVTTADAHQTAGAVGSLILFPDGRIQEAGSVIWSDGSTMPVGRDLPGDAPDWHFVRKVDFASACSLLVRRDAWEAVGGFDPQFHPAYYEDVDLCLALRARGFDVLFEPRSRLWHHESASSDDWFKRFLFGQNQRRLQHKWAATLATQEPPGRDWTAALARAVWRARGVPPRVLILDDRVPDSSLGSGFGRMFTAVQELSAAGYAVTLYPTSGLRMAAPDALVSAGVAILYGDLEAHVAAPWNSYDVIVVSRPYNFERLSPMLRRLQPQAVIVYDCEALFWRRTMKQATLTTNPVERAALEEAGRSMRAVEERIVIDADMAVTVSVEEAGILSRVEGCCPTHPLLPADPGVTFGRQDFDERSGIAYVAGWLAGSGSPNADGLRWFVSEVLPLVRTVIPWVRVHVTGANPPADLLALADPNVIFEGHIADLPAFYHRVRVVMCPIRFGAGVKVKTVQALQHGVPVVSTACGAEGIDTFGLDAMAIHDHARDFAAALVELLSDRARWRARRVTIAELVHRWHNGTDIGSWTHVMASALAMRESRTHGLFLHR